MSYLASLLILAKDLSTGQIERLDKKMAELEAASANYHLPFTLSSFYHFIMSCHRTQRSYWEAAGSDGYLNTYFRNDDARSTMYRAWHTVVDIGIGLNIPANGSVLDVGCGDGSFSNAVLAARFRAVKGVDFSASGIDRAQRHAPPAATFELMDLVTDDLSRLGRFDAVFLIGILHHVKPHVSKLLKVIRLMSPRLVILEPNGAHLGRKLLEFAPSYRAAGEDSFRHSQLSQMLKQAGFVIVDHRRQNIFPNFTPGWVVKMLRPIEPMIERTPVLRGLCTLNLYGCVAHP